MVRTVVPQVQVLMPVRNAVGTVDAAVDTVVAQRFRDWELTVVDNGSTDGTTARVLERSRQDARIHVLHEPMQGIAFALNTGLAASAAPFVARMDADDLMHPDRLALQVAYLQREPGVGVVSTGCTFRSTVAESRGMAAYVAWQNAILTPRQHWLKRFVDSPVAHPSVMFRRTCATDFGVYDTGPVPEDHALWLRWMHHGVRFAKLPQELLTWNDGPMRLSRNHPNYAPEAFDALRAHWLGAWYHRRFPEGRPVIIAGTGALAKRRAALLRAEGLPIVGYTDVKPGRSTDAPYIAPHALPPPGEVLVIPLISQRGTGDRIAAFLAGRGAQEGRDFILGA